MFLNRNDIDFANVDDLQPAQEWDLHEDPAGRLEYQTRITKFQNVTAITLFFPSNFSSGTHPTRISYIGFKV